MCPWWGQRPVGGHSDQVLRGNVCCRAGERKWGWGGGPNEPKQQDLGAGRTATARWALDEFRGFSDKACWQLPSAAFLHPALPPSPCSLMGRA